MCARSTTLSGPKTVGEYPCVMPDCLSWATAARASLLAPPRSSNDAVAPCAAGRPSTLAVRTRKSAMCRRITGAVGE